MGGRGGSSGLSAGNSERQETLRQANAYLSSQGLSRYDRVPQTDYPTTVVNHYYKMREQLESGKALSDNFSKSTGNELLKMIREERIRSAKRVLGSDSDDKRAISEYKNQSKQYSEMEKYIRNKSSGSAKKSSSSRTKTDEERKTAAAKKYFKEHYDPNRQQREITSSTYERAVARTQRDVDNFLGVKRKRKKRR